MVEKTGVICDKPSKQNTTSFWPHDFACYNSLWDVKKSLTDVSVWWRYGDGRFIANLLDLFFLLFFSRWTERHKNSEGVSRITIIYHIYNKVIFSSRHVEQRTIFRLVTIFRHIFLISCNFFIFNPNKLIFFYVNEFQEFFTVSFKEIIKICAKTLKIIIEKCGEIWFFAL